MEAAERERPENPINPMLRATAGLLRELEWDSTHALVSLISSIPLALVLLLGIALWPYGLFVIPLTLLTDLVGDTYRRLRATRDIPEAIPMVVSQGFFILMWLVFAAICLPLLIIVAIAAALARLFGFRSSS